MTHEDEGHYSLKHPDALALDDRIAEAVRLKAAAGEITCAASHKIAADLNVLPSEVGKTVDLMEIRVTKCQLGLFGYGPQRCIVEPSEPVTDALKTAILAAVKDERLTCLSAWGIADQMGLKKMDITGACEALKVKISSCQIGSFK